MEKSNNNYYSVCCHGDNTTVKNQLAFKNFTANRHYQLGTITKKKWLESIVVSI